jgi:2'-phosphotransferase
MYAYIVYLQSSNSVHTSEMPRPNDSPDVATSKTLAYILRHGAEKESLHIRSDGYIKLDDVVSLPVP